MTTPHLERYNAAGSRQQLSERHVGSAARRAIYVCSVAAGASARVRRPAPAGDAHPFCCCFVEGRAQRFARSDCWHADEDAALPGCVVRRA